MPRGDASSGKERLESGENGKTEPESSNREPRTRTSNQNLEPEPNLEPGTGNREPVRSSECPHGVFADEGRPERRVPASPATPTSCGRSSRTRRTFRAAARRASSTQ